MTLRITADVTALNARQRDRLNIYLLTDTDNDGVDETTQRPAPVCSIILNQR